ncbi:hypothetical protein [Aneurinibacillus sp. REN35]|uniref:hypothetical protein n=1 Tax=Aneurinibacillus sp. REN35 TaxID=3237286 RepID=UPI0035270B29
MENNIVSFEKHMRTRDESVRKRVLEWIDREEVHQYYIDIIEVSIRHLTRLQRYLVEEYLGEMIAECFFQGVDASKQYEAGYTTEEIESRYSKDQLSTIHSLMSNYRLYRHLGEWDLYSISIIAEDVARRWFRKGLAYGRKQRKLKLL